MDANTPQRQSWTDKPFLERLGIVLGILASIAAIVTLGYFVVDRYMKPTPVDATEASTTETYTSQTTMIAKKTEAMTTTEAPIGKIHLGDNVYLDPEVEALGYQLIAYGREIGLIPTPNAFWDVSSDYLVYGCSELISDFDNLGQYQSVIENDFKRLGQINLHEGKLTTPTEYFSVFIQYGGYKIIFRDGYSEFGEYYSDDGDRDEFRIGITRYHLPPQ